MGNRHIDCPFGVTRDSLALPGWKKVGTWSLALLGTYIIQTEKNVLKPLLTNAQPIVWSVHDGNLFANSDRVFPPTFAMTIDTELCDYRSGCSGDGMSIVYSLEASTICSSKSHTSNSPTEEGLRVVVGLTDQTGEPVTPRFVAIELTRYHGHAIRISAIRMISFEARYNSFMESMESSSMRGGQLRAHLQGEHPHQGMNQ